MNELLKEFAEFAEEGNYTVDADYSGRCMYGKTCFGIIGDQPPLGIMLQFVACKLESSVYPSNTDDDDELCLRNSDFKQIMNFMETMQKEMSWDNMGHQIIYYWPDISLETK